MSAEVVDLAAVREVRAAMRRHAICRTCAREYDPAAAPVVVAEPGRVVACCSDACADDYRAGR